ncbi:putative serine/threonine-protein kinase [Tetrabaena socialis]|uniref:Putative serine/threonine-protein kinase n=1 Tax=Tetrabaena socialis TaxID=47790 RepID=A0A2J8AH07_9CHLO|nr:putative serine/threonine-protein kinase [Tetrabaena socialis]|eukprot:PNH11808.1 putative serine/threonine-protein kinase [Tetrabaena socialis]
MSGLRGVVAVALALAVLAAAAAPEAITQRECHSGVELVRALEDETVVSIIIVNDIALSNADFSESLESPIVLRRNLTILGNSVRWPVLDLGSPNVRHKLRLSNGTVLALRHIILDNFRTGAHFQAPGFDVLAPCDPGDWGLVVQTDMALIQRACLPLALREQSLRAAPRPPNYPYLPNNSLSTNVSQAGCANVSNTTVTATGSVVQAYTTSVNAAVYPMDTCWPGVGLYVSVITYGFDVDFSTSKAFRTGYDFYGTNLLYYCAVQLSAACVATYTPLGCFLLEVPFARLLNATIVPPPPLPLPPPLAGAPVPAAGGGGGGSSGPPLGPVLGGVLGGAAVLAVLGAAALLLLRRRRRRRRAALGGKGSQPADGPGPEGVWVLVDGAKSVTGDAAAVQQTRTMPESAGCAPSTTGTTSLRSALAATGGGGDAMESGGGGSGGAGTCSSGTAEGRALLALLRTASEVAVPVTPCTPPRPEVVMGVRVAGATSRAASGATARAAAGGEGGLLEVKLLPVLRGRGTFGRVVEGMYGGERVAVKLIAEASVPMESRGAINALTVNPDGQEGGGGGGNGPTGGRTGGGPDGTGAGGGALQWVQASFAQEVEVLARCHHPNIVRLLAANVRPPRVCLVMELMETSLEQLVHGGGGGDGGRSPRPRLLPLRTVLHIATDIAHGLSYLHPTIVHRDLKDFGLSRLTATVGQTQNPEVGTPSYMGPEIFDLANSTVTDKADMWALGVVLWEMLTGLVPWSGLGLIDIACRITVHKERLPTADIAAAPAPGSPVAAATGGGARCPPRLLALMQQCWEDDPKRRPAAAEVVKELMLIQLSLEEEQEQQRRRQGLPSGSAVLDSDGGGGGSGGDGGGGSGNGGVTGGGGGSGAGTLPLAPANLSLVML